MKGGPPPPGLKGGAKPPGGGLKPKPDYKPGVKLKQINWNKLNANIVNKSVWSKLNDVPVNAEELEQYFCAAAAKAAGPATPQAAKPTIVNILDMRRGNNIAIGLSQIKGMSHSDIRDAIIEAKDGDKGLSADHLEMLAKFIPTKEEMDQIKAYTGDHALLGAAEKYFLVVDEIPNLGRKLPALVLKNQFAARVAKLDQDISVVKAAAEEITNSTNFLKFLEYTLANGNYLNAGTRNAQAYGFRIDDIKKLADTKASGRRISLLHYIIEQVGKKEKEVLSFPDGMPSLSKAAAAPLQTMATDLLALTNDVKSIDKELEDKDPKSIKFREVFETFGKIAKLDVENLTKKNKEMTDALATMFTTYGDDPKKAEDGKAIEEFYKMFVGFIQQFEVAKKDLEKEREAAAKAKAKAERAAKAEQSKPAGKKKEEAKSGGVLDNLFDSIKAGNFKLQRSEEGAKPEVVK